MISETCKNNTNTYTNIYNSINTYELYKREKLHSIIPVIIICYIILYYNVGVIIDCPLLKAVGWVPSSVAEHCYTMGCFKHPGHRAKFVTRRVTSYYPWYPCLSLGAAFLPQGPAYVLVTGKMDHIADTLAHSTVGTLATRVSQMMFGISKFTDSSNRAALKSVTNSVASCPIINGNSRDAYIEYTPSIYYHL